MKSLSVPRLELLGCLLLSQLIKEVVLAISSRVCVDVIFCWTDSEVELCQVKSKEKYWNSWLENRVVGIRKVVNRDKWRNIGRASNPADMPARVCDLKNFDSWFRGPAFLFQIKSKFEGCDATEVEVGGEYRKY